VEYSKKEIAAKDKIKKLMDYVQAAQELTNQLTVYLNEIDGMTHDCEGVYADEIEESELHGFDWDDGHAYLATDFTIDELPEALASISNDMDEKIRDLEEKKRMNDAYRKIYAYFKTDPSVDPGFVSETKLKEFYHVCLNIAEMSESKFIENVCEAQKGK